MAKQRALHKEPDFQPNFQYEQAMTSNQDMSDIRKTLIMAATLQKQGRLDEAERLHRQILIHQPTQPLSLQFLAARANQAGNLDEAASLMHRYLAIRPNDTLALEALAHIYEQADRYDEAVLCLGRALKMNNRDPRTLLLLGAALQKAGETMPAAAAASLLHASAPDLLELDKRPDATPLYKDASIRLRNAMAQHHKTVLDAAVTATRARFEACDLTRIEHTYWRPSSAQMAHDDRRPDLYYIPGIPQRPWLETTNPQVAHWVTALQAKTDMLREEVQTVLNIQKDTRPYIADHMKGREDWDDLAGQTDWSALHFYNNGKRNDAAIARFPCLAATLETLPLMRLDDRPVEAFLSVLHPGTRIPAHFGVANHRLTVHLPLIVPDKCGLSVNGIARQTVAGSVMIFDDSFSHHAWNDSDSIRVVLIFEIWVPELTTAERAAITHLLEEHAAFEAGRTALLSMPLTAPEQIISEARKQVRHNPADPLAWLDLAYGLMRCNRLEEAAEIIRQGEKHVPQIRQLHHDHRSAPHLRALSRTADAICRSITDHP